MLINRIRLNQIRTLHTSFKCFSHENPLGLPNYSKRSSKITLKQALPNIKKIVLVSSCKGGVGKSTVSTNLAIALKKVSNYKIGLLDVDIFGPSIPKLMNLKGEPRLSPTGKLIPLINYGIQTMSMGYLIPNEDSPVVWRGLMIEKVLKQLLFDVDWKDLDVLIVDLPPGTGDVQLTLSQHLKIDGAVIVSTPQDLALIDVKKGIAMFDKTKVPIFGLIENMSFFICPNCQHEEHLFGFEGVLKESKRLHIDLLGSIPLNKEICEASDTGFPTALNKDSVLAKPFYDVAAKIIDKLQLK